LPDGSLGKPVWVAACVSRLEPGEYAGAVRFVANEVQDDSADSRLALAINVRDPRVIPIVVLILGSIIGWFRRVRRLPEGLTWQESFGS
jgi:hypothetical protein